MTRIRWQQTAVTEYEADIDLPQAVTDHLNDGQLLDTLDDDAALALYEVLTTRTDGNDIDYRVDATLITGTDLPGHTLILPFDL